MSNSSAGWFRDHDAIVSEMRRGGFAAVDAPRIAGFDDVREYRRGGQGVVYSAIQRSTRRRVAIKVVLDGAFASASGRRRFEREVDLVAGMQHPNIVRVFDSGVTDDGRLYLVMEFIEGPPLDQFIAAFPPRELTRRKTDLLQVFTKVCDAVNYAHQRGVIHRDLKPGNVLIDNAGDPHVCDFGLAKAVAAPDAPDPLMVSMTGQFMGSLPWASPEQFDASHNRVDLRSDVYSLGVILYQLLTARLPYDSRGDVRQFFENLSRADPARPSTIFPGLDDELDTIVMKCLAREPDRRYQTAGELVADVRHYLAGEPIEAKADSTWYTLRKLARRHRIAAGAGATVLLAISIALVVSLRSWRSAVRARDDARQEAAQRAAIGEFLQWMLTSVDPAREGRDVKFLSVVNKAAEGLGPAVKRQPIVEAQIRRTLGASYAALGLYETAEKQLRAARTLAAGSLGPNHPTTVEIQSLIPPVVYRAGRLDDAVREARDSVAACKSIRGADDQATLRVQAALGEILCLEGKSKEAEDLLRNTIDGQRRVLGSGNPDTMQTLNALAILLKRAGRHAEAETAFREALAGALQASGPDDPQVLAVQGNLSLVLQDEGKLDEAESLQWKTLEAQRRVLGDQHPETLTTMSNLATLLLDRGRTVEAERLLRSVYEIEARTLGPENAMTTTSQNNLAKALQDLGRLDEARVLFEQALEIRRRILGPENNWTLTTAANLASLLGLTGDTAGARVIMRDVLDARIKTLGDGHIDTLISRNNLAIDLQRLGRLAESAEQFEAACQGAASALPEGHYATALFRGNYARCLVALGRDQEAAALLEASCQSLETAFGLKDPRTQRNIADLVKAYERLDDPSNAECWRAQLLPQNPKPARSASQPPAPPRSAARRS